MQPYTIFVQMELFSLVALIFTFFISLYLYAFFSQPKPNQPIKGGFKVYPLVGTLPDFFKNRHRFLDWTTEVLANSPTNTAVFRRPGRVHGVITANPDSVEYMLKTNFDNYPKGPRFISHMEDFLGKGIFNSDGELWKIQRKTASYEFNTRSLRNFVIENVKVEIETRLVPILEDAAKTNKVLDLQEILERFAFDNICKVAFDVDPCCLGGVDATKDHFMQQFDEATALTSGRFRYLLPFFINIKKFFNMGSEKKLRNSIITVHEFAENIIKSRMDLGGNKKDEDLLSRFMSNSEISAEFLRDIVINFILAGRDTTSSALTWLFWLLSSRPNVEQKILQELENIRMRNGERVGDTYDFEELRDMHYLQAAISESMRLYPPVPIDTKACNEDDVMPDGTFVGQNWAVSYIAYAMGRMVSVWGEDCCEYKPERWLENGIYRPESPFRFPVFHAGPRMCLGKDMAYIQMKSIVASVLERFKMDVLLEKGKSPEHFLGATLKMKGGLPVTVKERSY